jgi:hypothetical protein
MTKAKKTISKKAVRKWESLFQSGYEWPNPVRISIYIYPAQMRMIEEISRVWKKKKRDIFLEAVQQYIGLYYGWKNQPRTQTTKKKDSK